LDRLRQRVAFRGSDNELRSGESARYCERRSNVVAVADECDSHTGEAVFVLANGEKVCKGLARVLVIRERVDDGHVCRFGKLVQRLLSVGASDNACDITAEHTRDVLDWLPLSEPHLRLR